MSSADDRERLIAAALDRFGRIDVLVNNAGVASVARVEDEHLDDFRRVMEVNVTAIWHLCKLAAPTMIEVGGGSIVNVASMLGHVGSTPVRQAGYCASKGAVVNLTRELALQWARKGIRVNALCPGWFPSEMTAPMEEESSQAWIRANSPIPRMGEEHELDGALPAAGHPGQHVPHRAERDRGRWLDGALRSGRWFVSPKAGRRAFCDTTGRGDGIRSAGGGRPRAGPARAGRRRGAGRPPGRRRRPAGRRSAARRRSSAVAG